MKVTGRLALGELQARNAVAGHLQQSGCIFGYVDRELSSSNHPGTRGMRYSMARSTGEIGQESIRPILPLVVSPSMRSSRCYQTVNRTLRSFLILLATALNS